MAIATNLWAARGIVVAWWCVVCVMPGEKMGMYGVARSAVVLPRIDITCDSVMLFLPPGIIRLCTLPCSVSCHAFLRWPLLLLAIDPPTRPLTRRVPYTVPALTLLLSIYTTRTLYNPIPSSMQHLFGLVFILICVPCCSAFTCNLFIRSGDSVLCVVLPLFWQAHFFFCCCLFILCLPVLGHFLALNSSSCVPWPTMTLLSLFSLLWCVCI